MKAIVWDDEYEVPGRDHMKHLVRELTRLGVDCVVVSTPDELKDRVTKKNERFDLVVIDWLDTSRVSTGEARGNDIVVELRQAGKKLPIFVFSTIAEELERGFLALGKPLYVKSKDMQIPFVALEIIDQLRALGLYVDYKKVFVIYGHDRHANGARESLVQFLESDLGLEPVLVEPWRNQHTLLDKLQQHMDGCAAFVAICTPDDCVEEGLHREKSWRAPRQNVLFELGIAYGLGRGPERLTILEKHLDGDPDQIAQLPSDLAGYLTLRFKHSVDEKFPELKMRFEMLGLDVKPASGAHSISSSRP